MLPSAINTIIGSEALNGIDGRDRLAWRLPTSCRPERPLQGGVRLGHVLGPQGGEQTGLGAWWDGRTPDMASPQTLAGAKTLLTHPHREPWQSIFGDARCRRGDEENPTASRNVLTDKGCAPAGPVPPNRTKSGNSRFYRPPHHSSRRAATSAGLLSPYEKRRVSPRTRRTRTLVLILDSATRLRHHRHRPQRLRDELEHGCLAILGYTEAEVLGRSGEIVTSQDTWCGIACETENILYSPVVDGRRGDFDRRVVELGYEPDTMLTSFAQLHEDTWHEPGADQPARWRP